MSSIIKNSAGYDLISKYYNNRVADRSQVPLINHINEGLIVLAELGADSDTMEAFCIHPMLQDDSDLLSNFDTVAALVSTTVMALAIEYRSVANEYLSEKAGTGIKIRLSPLVRVNQMLIADKVQNCKDFIKYHKDTHPRSKELTLYFIEWIDRLEINEEMYQRLCAAIDNNKEAAVSGDAQLEEKVKVYEDLLHKIQMLAGVGGYGNHQKMQTIIQSICNWSYAHRGGNGELTDEEIEERISAQFEALKELAR